MIGKTAGHLPGPEPDHPIATRQILALAVPALGALVAEPLFLLVDTGIVGHLGRAQLAGMSAASAALGTLVSLCIFLAYGTTASVGRLLGAGDRAGALRAGYSGMWLAALLGVGLLLVAVPVAPVVVSALGAHGSAGVAGTTYLRISALGLPSMLLVLAATGVLRGMRRMRTTLVIAAAGAAGNAILNLILVYPVGLGIAGSATGTVLTQTCMAAAFILVAWRQGQLARVSPRPDWGRVRQAGLASTALLVRSIGMRVYVLGGTWVAGYLGTVSLAAHGVASNIWSFLALALDALAIAGQSIVAGCLGASDRVGTLDATRRMVRLGLVASLGSAAVVLLIRWITLPWFTPDLGVRHQLGAVLLVMAVLQPVSAVVFVLDGVLIGAGDHRFLAWASAGTTLVFLVSAGLAVLSGGGLVGLWIAVGVFLLARLITLVTRVRTSAWLVLGLS